MHCAERHYATFGQRKTTIPCASQYYAGQYFWAISGICGAGERYD